MAIDLALNEAQTLIQNSARDFFERNCPPQSVRELESSEDGFSREMWQTMAELGWLGVAIPEQYGGEGGSFLDLYPLYLEMGRFIVPSPHLDSCVLAAEILVAAANEAQKAALLPKIADGSLIVSPALLEANGDYPPHGVTLAPGRRGGAFVLDGTKILVPYANSAGQYLCAVRTGGGGVEDGISLLMVDASSPGITIERLPNIASGALFAVTFSGVTVPEANLVGALNRGWAPLRDALQRAGVLQAAMVVGAGERVLEMTADYAKDRVQFGTPIGRHQAVQYLVTDVLLDTHMAKLHTLHAAWLIDSGQPFTREAALAKAVASKAAAHMMRQAHEVHAGVAFMVDHDLQLYSRRAKYWEWNLGDARYHQDLALAAEGV